MASVCCFLLIFLRILQAQAETTRLRDWTPGQEFKRCLKAFDWGRLSADDEVAILDRDAETGCCLAGWVPGTQPLVRRTQTLRGSYPTLYTYGQISCGWRNATPEGPVTNGVVGQKPITIGAKCDYGTCYILHSNFSCGGGKPSFLNGCCPGGNYGSAYETNCRRSYFYEDVTGSNVKEDDLHLHLTCRQTTGPGWKNASGHPVPCEIDYSLAACYTRSTEEYLRPNEYGGTLTPDDDVIGGRLQPRNIWGSRWCPVATTTTTTTTAANMTSTAWYYDLIDPGNETNCTNCSDSMNLNVYDLDYSNTTTQTTVAYNTTTTTTRLTTTSNTTTTLTTTTTSTNTTTTSGPAGYVVGEMVCSADDPVAFENSVEVQEAMTEFLADLAGPYIIASMVQVTMTARTSDLFAETGGRRLMGWIDAKFRITVPIIVEDSGELFLGPEHIVKHFVGLNLLRISKDLETRVTAKGVSNLAITLYVQSISASKMPETTIMTSTTQTYTSCPKSQLCFSQTCGACDSLNLQPGVRCQKRMDSNGDCTCSCFEVLVPLTTPGPSVGLYSAATPRYSSVIVIGFVAAVVIRLHWHDA